MNAEERKTQFSACATLGAVISTAMVVAIHAVWKLPESWSFAWWVVCVINYGLFLIAVPFFYICSGYFLAIHMGEKRWWHREIYKRLRTVLIPFFIISLISVIISILCSMIENGRFLLDNIPLDYHYWFRAFGLNPFSEPLLGPLWYLRSLLLLVVLSPFLKRLLMTGGGGLLLLWSFWLLLEIVGCGESNRIVLFSRYCLGTSSMFWFSFGIYIRLHGYGLVEAWPELCTFRLNWICYLAFGCFVLLLSVVQRGSGYEFERIFRPFFIPCFVYCFCLMIDNLRKDGFQFPRWVSNNTFGIYLLHPIAFLVLSHLRQPIIDSSSIYAISLRFVVGLLIALLFSIFIRRTFPRFAGICFGGR